MIQAIRNRHPSGAGAALDPQRRWPNWAEVITDIDWLTETLADYCTTVAVLPSGQAGERIGGRDSEGKAEDPPG